MENIIHVLCIICAAVMLAMAAAMWLHERGLFEAMARFLPRSVAERLLLAVVVVGFIHYGATKEANGVRGVSAPTRSGTSSLRVLTQDEIDAGYALVRVGTNETFDFTAPSNAVIVEKWRRRGAAHDRFDVAPGAAQWLFPLGTDVVERLTVTSGGEVLPRAQGGVPVSIPAPYRAEMGIVPEMNWGLLPPAASPSMAWWEATPSNSLVVTWRNALVNRTTNRVASVQAEYFASGDFAHRYSPGTTNFTSLLYRRLDPLLDTPGGDRDGDGLSTSDELFIYGTDPGIPDTSGDGLLDGEAVSQGLDPLLRHLSDAEILERVAASSTNEAFASPVLATNSVAAWQMFGGFAADWPANATTNIVWERTFSVGRASAWQQLFVSASPDAAAWELRGAVLEWETDTGTSGCASASPLCDSLRIPLATNDMPQSVTLRVRASGAGFVRSPTPIYLVAYAPQFRVEGGSEIVGQSGATFYVSTSGAGSAVLLAVDHSRRPHRASPGDDECDMAVFEELTAGNDDFSYDGDATGGTITANRPGIYALPDFSPDVSPPMRLRSPRRGVGGNRLVVLDPSVWWNCHGHGCWYDGLGYDWDDDWYYEEDYYPLDSKCLRKKWYRHWHGGLYNHFCRLLVSSGLGDDDSYITTSTDGDAGKIFVDGVLVWSEDAEHIHDDWGCYEEIAEIEECDECDDDCANGNCDSMEGPNLGSLKFRIPLGAPVKNQVAGFVWFATEGPTNISSATFRLLAHPDATITETASAGTRRIACHDSRGRDLRISDIANGARVTIYDTAAQTLEHTWEIVNVGGCPSCVRLRKISRLDNVMSDETFTYSDGDWTRFDNIANVGTRLTTYDDFSDYGDGTKCEVRTTTDERGRVLECVITERSRVGDCDNAVLRETYREEWTGTEWKWSQADYWNDPAHSGRHGRQRLVWGNACAWVYTDFDGKGHEVLRVEQRGGADVPADFPYVVSNELCNVAALSDAYVTVRDFAPLDGDSRHQDDAAKPRCETRYVVRNGVATVIGRTSWRYTRLFRDGYAAIKRETWRAAENSPTPSAYSYEVTYADTGDGTPLLMRNAAAETLDEDGILTVNSYSLSGGVLSCESRRFGRETSDVRREFETYETVESDASYGTVLRRTTRLTANGAAIADEQSIYDSQNRLRSTTYLDGTSLTNAYSCCRLLWKRDREGRRVLRSAQTGTDHLYNAMEDVWLADVSTNGQYRVTQHFYDALGRETNTAVYVGTTPGEATSFSTTPPLPNSRTSTTYPYGGSAYSIATDERGKVTVRRADVLGDCIESGEAVFTNGVEVAKTKSRSYFGGGSSMRREWGGDKFTEESRFTDYAADGSRIEYVVTDSYDNGTVTNSVSTYDLLGRLVSKTVSGANGSVLTTTYTYDGTTGRILSAATTGSPTVTYGYNEHGERISTSMDGRTVLTEVSYETISQQIYRVTTTANMAGGITNSVQIRKVQMTGLSDALRSRIVTIASGRETVTETAFDVDTGILNAVSQVGTATPVTTRSIHCVTLDQTSIDGTSEMSYDALGRNVAVAASDASGVTNRVDSLEYDQSGNVVRRVTDFRDGRVAEATAEYDMLNREVRRTDALGNETVTAYDPLGRTVSTSGDAYPIMSGYDSVGRKTHGFTTRDGGATWDETQWEFDPASGVNTAKQYADGSRISYDYTDNGKKTRTTWARGAWKENAYNARNLVSGMTYSGMDTPSVAYTYTDSGKTESATLSDGTSYAYGYEDQLLNTNESVTVGGDAFVINRTFDGFMRELVTSVTITNVAHSAKTRLYDSENRVCGYALTNAAGRGVSVLLAYDGSYVTNTIYTMANGSVFSARLSREAGRRNLVTRRDYLFGGQSIYWYSTEYDLLNRPTNATDSVSLVREWLYNRRSELAAASVGTNLYGYAYDTIGNRLWSAANAVTNSYTANSLNQYSSILRAPAPPREPTYDADGNMTSDGAFSYSYDAENRLLAVYPLSPAVGSLAVENRYDHRHRRSRKVVKQYDGADWETKETHTCVWDGNNIVFERVEFANGTTRTFEYFWGADKSGSEQGAGGVEGLLAVSMDGVFYIPCYDHNGNIILYVSEMGSIAAQYTYDPYGNVIDSYGNLAEVFSFGFSTQYHDRETGMVSYQQRFLIPTIGRWLNRDPIEEDGGVNLYGFCGNSPICNHDKNGCAYFAVRKLKGSPDIMPWSTFFVCPFMKIAADFAADALNVELVHEQLFFEDSGHDLSNVGWGTDKNGRGKRLENEPKNGYTRRDGGYDDCIMRIAVGEVNPTHYQLTWVGSKSKCNCQDYADALRTKYRELSNDPNVKCKCKKGK